MTDQEHTLDAYIPVGDGWGVKCKCGWASPRHAEHAEAVAAFAAHCDAPDDGPPSIDVFEV